MPSDWARAQGLLCIFGLPARMDPRAAADIPDEARTASSEASSIRRRMVVTERNTPGSMGGGIGLPGGGAGSGGYDSDARANRGESGGEESPRPA
jgi:hypothetical protein